MSAENCAASLLNEAAGPAKVSAQENLVSYSKLQQEPLKLKLNRYGLLHPPYWLFFKELVATSFTRFLTEGCVSPYELE